MGLSNVSTVSLIAMQRSGGHQRKKNCLFLTSRVHHFNWKRDLLRKGAGMKIIKKILIGIVVLFFILVLIKDQLIKSAVTLVSTQVLGAQVKIDGLSIGVFHQEVRVKGLKVYNPAGFPNEIMVDIPEISVDYDLASLMQGKLHLPLVVVDLKEMVVIKNKEGKLNVDSLKVVEKKEAGAKEEPAAKVMPMQIDQATLNLGKVIVKDYSKAGAQPLIQAYDIGVKNKTFKNITSAQQFAALVLVQAMGPTALHNAAIYGAATFLGVGFLPAGIAGVILAEDSGTAEFNVNTDKAYHVAVAILKKSGEVTQENKAAGTLKGKVNGTNIVVDIVKKDRNKVQVKVTARKYMLARPEIAKGVLYEISEALK